MSNKTTTTHPAHIAVLMGGLSSERDVSLSSGQSVCEALTRLGHQVTPLDVQDDIIAQLQRIKPDIAFNALHGTYGEDGRIAALLELLHIPYTHSGVTASALGMQKILTKKIAKQIGIRVAGGGKINSEAYLSDANSYYPHVIKPIEDGSSVGVYIVKEKSQRPTAKQLAGAGDLMMEPYIPGQELSVAVINSQALGVIELRPKQGFYDYTNKYNDNHTDHIMPAEVPDHISKQAMEWSEKIHQELDCKGVSRSDFRYDTEQDKLYFLEINTHPGLTDLSLVPEIAAHGGVGFDQLIAGLLPKI